jgi:hypothetical protein
MAQLQRACKGLASKPEAALYRQLAKSPTSSERVASLNSLRAW